MSAPQVQYEPIRRDAIAATDGLYRVAFTVDDVYKMVEAGILHEDDRIELIEGELIQMPPKGNHHEVVKGDLIVHFARRLPEGIMLIPETTFRLSAKTYLEPDIVFYRRSEGLKNLRGDNALLVIEVADTSLSYDRGRKAALYARYGVRELWSIDAVRLMTRIYKQPDGDEYKLIEDKAAEDMLAPDFAPELAVRLADLDLG